ncbi:hypothetical protein DB347_24495 [Opitutaceae bacterium EW11]|nr:hypothetical protein DB347_24495 [Opitutaceae bacterium EW11]
MTDLTRLIEAVDHDDPTAAEELLPLVYEELRRLAASRLAVQPPGQTLQATAQTTATNGVGPHTQQIDLGVE